MGIQRDLGIGAVGEGRVIDLLGKLGYKAIKNTVKSKLIEYDLMFTSDGKDIMCEVKYDLYSAKSGNIAIEVANSRKGTPSGLMATKAQLWFHITDDIYCARTKDMLDFVSARAPSRIITHAGDGNAYIYLYPAQDLYDSLFVRLDVSDLVACENFLNELIDGV